MKKHSYPNLPLLNELTNLLSKQKEFSDLSKTYIVCIQHILESTGTLISKFIELGFPRENIFLLGKFYSTNIQIEKELIDEKINYFKFSLNKNKSFSIEFKKAIAEFLFSVIQSKNFSTIDRIIFLDEGGFCLEAIKTHSLILNKRIIGIEQTSSGLYKKFNFDSNLVVIEVANSATKKYLESPLIIADVISKIKSKLSPALRIGIVGLGNLGKNLFNQLKSDGFNVYGFDKKKIEIQDEFLYSSINELILNSDIIIGCTGVDISSIEWLTIGSNKIFISCSSTDIEFFSLIEHIRNNFHSELNPLNDIIFKTTNGCITILNGGFPITFKQERSAVDSQQIQITRGLNLIAVFQALKYLNLGTDNKKSRALEPYLQKIVVQIWFKYLPYIKQYYNKELIEKFNNVEWISNNS